METERFAHRPVLIDEVMDCLRPDGSAVIIDGTFGRGGYTTAILKGLSEKGRVLALDVDPEAIAYGEEAFRNEPRLTLLKKNYDQIVEALEEVNMPVNVDGIVFDLGVSSPQLDDAARGFSFLRDGPLDMRMDPGAGLSAAAWLRTVPQQELSRVIAMLGEERMSGRIARAIVTWRDKTDIQTTAQLSEVVTQAIPEKEQRKRKIHPATKTFQAIRMYINDELQHLKAGLHAAINVLALNGVLVVVTFHSLEDRIVKRLFRESVSGPELPDRLPVMGKPSGNYEYVEKLVTASPEEQAANPRARSAKLRAIRRIQ